MATLALKVLLAPALVVAATLAGRRWGDRAGGLVIAIPVVAGPILLILAIDHGRAFAGRAACGALIGIVAVAAFCLVFDRMAARGLAPAVAVGWLTFAVLAYPLSRITTGPLASALIAVAAIAAARVVLGPEASRPSPRGPAPAWDLWARAGVTCALVLALTSAASALGPRLSGVLTPFPVATTVLVGFTLVQGGPSAVRNALRGFLTALPGFAAFFFVVALAMS